MHPVARSVLSVIPLSLALAGCGVRYAVPLERAHDARFGYLAGGGTVSSSVCRDWSGAFALRDPYAESHVSYPETNPVNSCFSPVSHEGDTVRASLAPRGCGFPSDTDRDRMRALATALEQLADSADLTPTALFPCDLTAPQRRAASLHNARTLLRLAAREGNFPYAAVITPGHGLPAQNQSSILGFLPGDACSTLDGGDLRRFGAMVPRAIRASQAVHGNVAPVVIASGGAIHGRLVEAFALLFLLQCFTDVPVENVIVEPCADHTHTNMRNSGRWLTAMGGRAAYLLTDNYIQSDYFQDFSGFELLFGSIDQRSRRDWGYVLGSWRQASQGSKSGFWYTPYRFWAEPREGLGSFTCVGE